MGLRALSFRASFAAGGLAFVAFAAVKCTPSTDQGSINLLTVDDPFDVDGGPPATTITVEGIDYDDGGPDGAITTLARAPLTAGVATSIDLGTYDETTTQSLLVSATDRAGTIVAWGESLPLELGAVAGVTLDIFVQRTGTLSRMPSPLGDGRSSPLLNIVGGRYILVAGGSDTANSAIGAQTDLYDLIAWAPLPSPPALPVAPLSTAIGQPTAGDFQVLAITSTGASWFDLTSSESDDASAPTGAEGSWADVAGGATITSTDQSTSFVVGGTRTSEAGPATSTVLIVTSTGALTWANLSTPRLGATASYVDGLGLIVEGGNVTASSAGAEYLSVSSTVTPIPFPYASDPTTGAGMTALDATHVLVVGGASGDLGGNGARVLTVPCDGKITQCTSTPWQPTLPTPLTFTQVFDIDATDVFVVGEDASGFMHAYTLSPTQVAEVPFRVPRSHARAIRLPVGNPGAGPIAIVGGDPNIESFIPFLSSPEQL